MKYTLLEIVQEVLNEMDSDFVNSIDDTVESQQVALIAKSCFNEMITNRNWPHLRKLVQLDALADSNRPNFLKIPAGVKQVEDVAYDKRKTSEGKTVYEPVKYLYPDEFLQFISSRDSTKPNVLEIRDLSGVPLNIFNDAAPTYYTTFDDIHLVFDSYNSAVDDTLQKSKSRAIAYVDPGWDHTDNAVPNLPEHAFAAYVEEVKATSFYTLKQMVNEKAERKSTRQQRWLSRKARKAHSGVRYNSYGRT